MKRKRSLAVTIKEIYAPVLGFGWENLPNRYIQREYIPIENGLVTSPSGTVIGTATLPSGKLRLLSDKGQVCAQRWTGQDEMLVVDPFDNRVFTVPSVEDLKCNAREMVSAHINVADAKPLDLSIMWTDDIAGECGFDISDIPEPDELKYTYRLNGMSLLGLVNDGADNLVVSRTSVLCRLLRYKAGDRFAFQGYRKKNMPGLLNDSGGFSDFARKILAWSECMTPEQREILSK